MKKIQLQEGDLFSIKIENNIWTIAQLCNIFKFPNSRLTTETLTFFNYTAESEEQIIKEINDIDLSRPFFITTISGHPIKFYELSIIGNKKINYTNLPNYKNDISKSGGDYKNITQDYEDILKSFFGILPWDKYAKDDYMETSVLPNFEKRNDVKYMKDFTIEQLQKILPARNVKLIKLLENK